MIPHPLVMDAPFVVLKDRDSNLLTLKVEVVIDDASSEVLIALVSCEKALSVRQAEAIKKLFARRSA